MIEPCERSSIVPTDGSSREHLHAVPQIVLLVAQICTYAIATLPCVPLVRWLGTRFGTVGWAVAIGVGFHLWGACVILTVAGLRWVLGGPVRPGTYPLSSPEARRWLRNLALCEIATRSPFFALVHHYPLFAVIFYRMMGAQIAWRVRIGYGARLTDPWLTRVGRDATIGERALLLGHFIEGTSVVLGEVSVGPGSTVGVMSVVSPGCRVGAGATLGACSMLPKGRSVPEGESWGGTPARRLRPACHPVLSKENLCSLHPSGPQAFGRDLVAGRSCHERTSEDCGGHRGH